MRIYRMQATFGKLERQTLELQPGLNVIQAPNEWGKSTWCAFLTAMLYGIDTRTRTTQTALAEKEKYMPWSGSPMEGRIDLCWNGRDITIERRTKGRVPFGSFSAYETKTGLAVQALSASNCGQQLLGVEKSVFVRAGFLRLDDLPVTQNEELRRRLNALVTTGDESSHLACLSGKLRELKNRCRYHRTGLIPQAQAEKQALEEKLRQALLADRQLEEDTRQLEQLDQDRAKLENHQMTLRFVTAQADAARLFAVEEGCVRLRKQRDEMERTAVAMPSPEETDEKLQRARALQTQVDALQMEGRMLPQKPECPPMADEMAACTPTELLEQVHADGKRWQQLKKQVGRHTYGRVIALICVAMAAGVCTALRFWPGVIASAGAAVGILVWLIVNGKRRIAWEKTCETLAQRYSGETPQEWERQIRLLLRQREKYERERMAYQQAKDSLERRTTQLRDQVQELTNGQELSVFIQYYQQAAQLLNDLADTRRALAQEERHLESLRAMVHTAQKPQMEDCLTFTEEETRQRLLECDARQRQLQMRIGAAREKISGESQGEIQTQIVALQQRIDGLERIYRALELAQQTLSAATEQLQRRFAPGIAVHAQRIFAHLTDERYDRLNLTGELAVNTGAQGETTLHSAQWRSDGTADQLYIALRLAVAERLTPGTPLVLDDVLVRFDDKRLQNALSLLKEIAQTRQVILFTCQGREAAVLEGNGSFEKEKASAEKKVAILE